MICICDSTLFSFCCSLLVDFSRAARIKGDSVLAGNWFEAVAATDRLPNTPCQSSPYNCLQASRSLGIFELHVCPLQQFLLRGCLRGAVKPYRFASSFFALMLSPNPFFSVPDQQLCITKNAKQKMVNFRVKIALSFAHHQQPCSLAAPHVFIPVQRNIRTTAVYICYGAPTIVLKLNTEAI